MFRPGSKVKVLASTFTKKTGPKKGSVGYVISSEQIYYLPHERCCVCRAYMLFTRYGLEKSRRSERKSFINIMPIIQSAMDRSSLVMTVENMVQDFKLAPTLWQTLCGLFPMKGNRAVYVGIMAPLKDNTDLSECDGQEFINWLDSMLSNHAIREAMETVRNSGHMKGAIKDKFIVEMIRQTLYDKYYKSGVFSSLKKDKKLRKSIMRTLQQILTIYSMRTSDREERSSQDWFEDACRPKLVQDGYLSPLEEDILLRSMAKDFYCDFLFKRKKELAMSAGNKQLDTMVENIDVVRNHLARLSQIRESNGQ